MQPEAISEKIQHALVIAKRLQMGGHLADARRACTLVLRLDPENGDARLRLGLIARQEGQTGEALAMLSAALQRMPRNTFVIRLLATAQREAGRLDDAERLLDLALSFAPDDGGLLVERGRCHIDRGAAEAALPLFEKAAQVAPDYGPAHSVLGIAYRRAGRGAEAFRAFETALKYAPDDAAALNGIGNEYLETEDFDRAIGCYRKALAKQPDFVSAQKNLAYALGLANRLAEARQAFEQLMAIAPANAECHMDYGLFLLSVGDYDHGWQEYEHRWNVAKFDERDWGQGLPRWLGEPRADGPILLWGEQGIGDQILYGTQLRDILDRDGTAFVIAVDRRLVPLFQRTFATPRVSVIERGIAVTTAAQCPFGSLGAYVRRDAGDFGSGAYLRPDTALRDRLRARYAALGKPGDRLVGLSWRSINWNLGNYKSLDLETLLPLLRQEGNLWINLQYGDIAAEIEQLARRHGIVVHRDPDIDPTRDLDGLAAQIAALDCVVSSSNSTVHFAGALGVPCYVLLPAGRGRMWYWPRDGETTPWYGSIRLLRQQTAGDWAPAIAQAGERLKAHG